MKNIPAFVCSLITLLAPLSTVAADTSRFEGLSGRALADAVRAEFAPLKVPSDIPVADYVPSDWPDGWLPEVWCGDGSRIDFILPQLWTREPLNDLYNLFRTDNSFFVAREDFPPGDLVENLAEGNGWKVGIIKISGYETNGWEPTADRKGDLARRIMYLALMYPRELWGSRGTMLLADGEWPLLMPYGAELLGEWSEADPPDERELAEAAAIADIQGNHNPFLEILSLFDYLWGAYAGQGFVPDTKRDRSPLKGTYSRENDRFIDLYSPYVPENASWFFDGSPVEGESIDLSTVSLGSHIISYTSSSESGKLKISVSK